MITQEIEYTLNCDGCGESYMSRDGFPKPQYCSSCMVVYKAGAESQLLKLKEAGWKSLAEIQDLRMQSREWGIEHGRTQLSAVPEKEMVKLIEPYIHDIETSECPPPPTECENEDASKDATCNKCWASFILSQVQPVYEARMHKELENAIKVAGEQLSDKHNREVKEARQEEREKILNALKMVGIFPRDDWKGLQVQKEIFIPDPENKEAFWQALKETKKEVK